MRHRETDTDFDAAMAAEKRENRWFRFSPNFDAGTLVTVFVLVFGAGGAWMRIESYNDKQITRSTAIEDRAKEETARTAAALTKMEAAVTRTSEQVGDLKTKVELLGLQISQQARK